MCILYIYIHILCIYRIICIYINYVYVCIYIDREREGEKETPRERERETHTQRDTDRLRVCTYWVRTHFLEHPLTEKEVTSLSQLGGIIPSPHSPQWFRQEGSLAACLCCIISSAHLSSHQSPCLTPQQNCNPTSMFSGPFKSPKLRMRFDSIQGSPIKISGLWCFRIPRRLVWSVATGLTSWIVVHFGRFLIPDRFSTRQECQTSHWYCAMLWALSGFSASLYWAVHRWRQHPSAQSSWSCLRCHSPTSRSHLWNSLDARALTQAVDGWCYHWCFFNEMILGLLETSGLPSPWNLPRRLQFARDTNLPGGQLVLLSTWRSLNDIVWHSLVNSDFISHCPPFRSLN